MNTIAKPLTVDDFLAWSVQQPAGRHELLHGEIIAMAPERLLHRRVKHLVVKALETAIEAAGAPCRAEPDGATVRIDDHTAYEPDSLVYCGPELPNDSIEIPDPVIIVEVLSPSTEGIDTGHKFSGYFKLPSVQHYLILDPVGREVIHHQRQPDGAIRTLMLSCGTLRLDPPGLTVPVGALFPGQPRA